MVLSAESNAARFLLSSRSIADPDLRLRKLLAREGFTATLLSEARKEAERNLSVASLNRVRARLLLCNLADDLVERIIGQKRTRDPPASADAPCSKAARADGPAVDSSGAANTSVPASDHDSTEPTGAGIRRKRPRDPPYTDEEQPSPKAARSADAAGSSSSASPDVEVVICRLKATLPEDAWPAGAAP